MQVARVSLSAVSTPGMSRVRAASAMPVAPIDRLVVAPGQPQVDRAKPRDFDAAPPLAPCDVSPDSLNPPADLPTGSRHSGHAFCEGWCEKVMH